MTRRTAYLMRAIALAVVLGVVGCNGGGGVNPLTTNVTPTVSTMAYIQTKGILPLNCNDWLSPTWKLPCRISRPNGPIQPRSAGLSRCHSQHRKGAPSRSSK